MAFKYIRDSLPWFVPSAAIVLAASGALDGLNIFSSDEPAVAQAPVPQTVSTIDPSTLPTNVMVSPAPQVGDRPILGAGVVPSTTLGVNQDNVVTRQANSATSLGAIDPLATPATAQVQPNAVAAAVPVPTPTPAPTSEERQASLKPITTFSPSFSAPAARNQCVDDLRNLAAQARVYFPSGGLAADSAGIEQGRLLGTIAESCPGVQIVVEGHSDPSGDPGANLRLSTQRAANVIQRIAASGVDTSKFVAQGFGDQRPSGIVGPEPRWFYDRRVEFSIVTNAPATPAFGTQVAKAATPWTNAACVKDLEQAVASTALFYAPGSVSLQANDLDAAMRLAEMAMQCPQARLRIIGHHVADVQARESVATGLLRAKALMAMLVGRGVASDELIIAAYSRASGGAREFGMPGSRVNFDVILEDG